MKSEQSCGNMLEPDYYHLENEELYLQSERGYRLCAHYYRAKKPKGVYVLFNHGHTYPYISAIKYLPLFLPRGINVIIPDHVGHGRSDDGFVTFGFYEHRDSMAWIGKLQEIAKADGVEHPVFGVMGESMGAAISLLMAAKDSRLSFCIADCGYTSWNEIIRHQIITAYPRLLVLALPLARAFIRIASGARVKDVNILQAAQSLQIPALIIHGGADQKVPTEMGRQLAQSNKLFRYEEIPGATHANSIAVDYPRYKKVTDEFLTQMGV
ncbi:alpha/beta hydrolase [Acetanaerobacterium elongatum]|nr:alpha/beta fold hydrolase [Acetanaerobacterium elongatum]